jgi:hypothetical protein
MSRDGSECHNVGQSSAEDDPRAGMQRLFALLRTLRSDVYAFLQP